MSVRESTFSSVASTNHADRHILAKVTRRLIPFLFTCFVLNYIDRINVGFAKLHFQDSLGFSDAVFGLGLSLFFVGYLLFEVPSNLLLARFGARKTISRIMVLWGLVSIATMFVKTSTQFYIGRFLLGVAEAGFAPGIVLYLSYWYDTRQRARVTSMFFLALPIAGVIGNPISGLIMSGLNGVQGLEGWQWLFQYLAEGKRLAEVVRAYQAAKGEASAEAPLTQTPPPDGNCNKRKWLPPLAGPTEIPGYPLNPSPPKDIPDYGNIARVKATRAAQADRRGKKAPLTPIGPSRLVKAREASIDPSRIERGSQ